MARKHKSSRLQYGLFATPLEDLIAPDNLVRVIDAFVDALPLEELGFYGVEDNNVGAASYDPADLLKLYFYGYFNRIRSSRMLERECGRNVELMWLIGRQTPCFRTIAGFRTFKLVDKTTGGTLFNHRKAIPRIFRLFNRFLQGQDLFGLKTVAVDGTKIAAQNSKKRHISEDKIARKLERVEQRMEEYLDELAQADLDSEAPEEVAKVAALLAAIDDMEANKERIMQLDDLLLAARAKDPLVTQVSLTDPDARMLPINNEGMMQVAYNVQSTVDAQHSLIADYSVENEKDLYLLSPMAASLKSTFDLKENIELLADKGYHSGKGLQECEDLEVVTTYVAVPEQTYRDRPTGFQKEDFVYDEQADTYICPNKKVLKTSGTWHEKRGRRGRAQASYQLYRSSYQVCSECPFRDQCLSKSSIRQRHGRTIERSEYEAAAQANRRRILLHRDKYKRRQAIVEHPFGTIKRAWGYYYTLLKGKEKVTAEMGIVFTTYNLRRAVTLMGIPGLITALKAWEIA